ncbi:staphyloferrin B biosynthesis protein SbnF [Staphylococcus intermedius]|uniref:Siderophore biosynthesis protein, IucC family n=1 Tax=Staphylococcus intermedius NCTC 11048 TaxID=1141106 RepID=A0A380G931_STAIN|nr:staphyloferrin B biosynthesis protein SbnF [Staphylococcus intermedius]PCF65561.1 siderophore biosynthesis protein SbnF [Staphylococcus intermedius]PCF81240.1 siderophore biosynthesis protein SbnF [Staphylococcus intermedius]PCF82523.1 siderophore biosynthesis protein SbnF [Staphylococcus intermedius]PCF87222.1 siderophore biosynthesis protein SbnF [Staphylococcus intermedius]PNZ54108.1 siderophore biosynthesis protein SbnF [Staphylococcus intermedius NCTC 11048]
MKHLIEQVRRRIMQQLVTSLIYEDVVRYDRKALDDEGCYTYEIEGEAATYRVQVQQSDSFERLTLISQVWRIVGEDEVETLNYVQLLRDVHFTFEKDEQKLEDFIIELLQTELKDTQARRYRAQQSDIALTTFDDYESYAMEGHMYHPSYKSRLGFTLTDNERYGPDFRPSFQLQWIAIAPDYVETTVSHSVDTVALLKRQLGSATLAAFEETLQQHGHSLETMVLIPVHPWQFEHIIQVEFAEAWMLGEMLWLGTCDEMYVPQQSIRTLTPTNRDKYYLKTPISITNTSTKRVLAPHTIENAAQITDWLKHIQSEDTYLQHDLKTIFLGEVLGHAYHNPTLSEAKQQRIYGALGVIWRENLHHYLAPNESAIPFNALYSMGADSRPLIDAWMTKYGTQQWMAQFLTVAVTPMIHMLYYHGIAFESHAQNMMLIHEEGWPTRIALKDFHDGIRFKPSLLSEIAQNPQLRETPEAHRKVNQNSFIETEDVALVRDFLHDAFFFINIAEIIDFVARQYEMKASEQWEIVRAVISQYQQTFPDLPNYRQFDLFVPTIQVEKLTTRRLREDVALRLHEVSNPLRRSEQ